MSNDIKIQQFEDPPQEDLEYVREKFLAFNDRQCGVFPAKALNLFAYGTEEQIIAGLVGEVSWGWLHVDIIWVLQAYRRLGIGSTLMDHAETEAIAMGVNQAYLETTDFQAAGFYEKRGYHIFARLDDQPPGHVCFYMKNTDLKNYDIRSRN